MADIVESLILDLLQWIGPEPRPYADVIVSPASRLGRGERSRLRRSHA